ncbi:hypothetical protein AB0M45_30455 [Nocardia sp. NPDC051787]|uniref:hypothetical protein n=1 Tax=Nocardia sp. NPDC051787 TaxID=3155415 RepID=UPI00342FB45F
MADSRLELARVIADDQDVVMHYRVVAPDDERGAHPGSYAVVTQRLPSAQPLRQISPSRTTVVTPL